MTSRRIALHDGTLQTHCVIWGSPSTPPIVMLHGLRAYGQWFEEFAEAAAADFYLIAPDQRGRGSTDWAKDGRYDTDAYVADLLQLADNWPLRRFAIVGHSMGGTNAINFAARYPARVSALVIIDSAPELNPLGLARITREASAMPPSFDSEAAARSYLRASHVGASERSITTRLARALAEQDGRLVWRLDPAIFPLKPDPPERSWAALAAIECPTLIVRAGDSDLVTIECANRMVQTLKHGEGVSVPNAGHMVLEDNPEGFTNVAWPFLKKHLS
ncbi:MAG: alpha/beta hydrolase [Candidatus Korobacteraceae bacterium]